MNKVTINLQGGLGNYMFQIACAYTYSKKYNKELILNTEDSVVIHKHLDSYKDNILNNVIFKSDSNIRNYKPIQEHGFHYNEIPFLEGDVFLSGYFQSEKYFKEYEEEIKKLFSFPAEYIERAKNIIKQYNSNKLCSIHIRRGDYLNSPNHHPTQNMNYYMKAIKMMPKDSVFLIFSDDISWCKESFPDMPEKFIFVESGSDVEDLLLMSMCKNNIICNSTFSWWAAWLNENPDKIVISPSNWFGPAYSEYVMDDLYCENWIKI